MIEGISPSGVRYAVRRRAGAVAFAALSIQAGTRNEGGFPSGIAHFTEHTLFRGTARKSARVISGYLDRYGGELNAYTTKEEIVLHATVLREDLPRAAALLLELASEARFPEKEIETERGVVIDEIISYKDTPADDVYDRFESELFKGHPLGGLILGTRESVSSITSADLKAYVQRCFLPSRMAFTLVADQEERFLEQRLLKLLAATFPTPGTATRQAVEQQIGRPWTVQPFAQRIDQGNHEVNAVLGGLAPSLYGGRERIATILLTNLLGGPASNSLLGSYLRERNGWVYGIECSYTQYADQGLVAVSFGCDRPNLDKCLRGTERILASLRDKALSQSRLRAAKKQLLCQMAISAESGEATCLSMGKSLLAYGRVIPDEESREAILSLSAEDLQDCAQKVFAPEALSQLIYL